MNGVLYVVFDRRIEVNIKRTGGISEDELKIAVAVQLLSGPPVQ